MSNVLSSSANIFLLEDEVNVGSTLMERLCRDGFDVTWTKSKREAMETVLKSCDLAILDVGLPDGTGFEFAEVLRKQYPQTAILFLTAYGTPEDRIRGLELGAEDYVVKPFNYKELLLRIQNILRRRDFINSSGHAEFVQLGSAKISFSGFFIEKNTRGENVRHVLTHKECSLLKLLYSKRGQVVSRDEILDHVWSKDEFPTPRTIDNFILKLRKLIEEDPENPKLIRSVRGVGYQLFIEEDKT